MLKWNVMRSYRIWAINSSRILQIHLLYKYFHFVSKTYHLFCTKWTIKYCSLDCFPRVRVRKKLCFGRLQSLSVDFIILWLQPLIPARFCSRMYALHMYVCIMYVCIYSIFPSVFHFCYPSLAPDNHSNAFDMYHFICFCKMPNLTFCACIFKFI